MADNYTTLTRKYVLIPERSDSDLWAKRVYEYTVSDLKKRIAFYEDQLENSKKKEMKEKARVRLESLDAELEDFISNPEITQKVINNYTYGLVRTAMSEESAKKNYIVEYVRMVLTAEHAYAMNPKDRNKRINEILKFAYRRKGSKKGSLFDETEIGSILGSYGIGFSQMLTKKIQDCCNRGALEGRERFPFYKEDSPFTVSKSTMGFSHEYDSYEELCEHLNNCRLYFDYGGNGKPHIARFRIDVGHGKAREEALTTLLKVYSGEYLFCGSSIQISKNKIILNLVVQIPKQEKELDEDTTVGVCLGMMVPATCALNNDNYKKLSIGNEQDFLNKRTAFRVQRRTLQVRLKETSGGHGRKKKLQGMERLEKAERNYIDTYCHMISKQIVEFALKNNAKYINMEKLSASNDTFVGRNSIVSKVQSCTQYKAEVYGITVRFVNPCYNAQVCSVDGTWAPDQRESRTVFECSNPDCKSHSMYKRGFDAEFNHARNVAMSTLFMESGSASAKSMKEAREYYGIADTYENDLEESVVTE